MECCNYCSESEFVITCLDCNEHYCNNTSGPVSHIINHLQMKSHFSVKIDVDIMCTICRNSNIFDLGYKKGKILCRKCGCFGLEDTIWAPFVSERCLNSSYFPTMQSSLSFKQLEKKSEEEKANLKPFTSGMGKDKYVKLFTKMINLEAVEENKIKTHLDEDNVDINFSATTIQQVKFTSKKNASRKVVIGDELRFSNADFIFTGYVISYDEDIVLVVQASSFEIKSESSFKKVYGKNTAKLLKNLDKKKIPGFTVRYICNLVSYERMKKALKKITNMDFFDKIYLGTKETHTDLHITSELNESQKLAINASLSRDLTLIQGPPGTGKTITSAEIVENLARMGYRVLVTAPSNIAADNLANEIRKRNVKVIRVLSRNRESAPPNELESICLHHLVRKNLSARYKGKYLDEDVDEVMRWTMERNEKRRLLKKASVICCTCNTAGSPLFINSKFDAVIIDEAAQATEPQSLIPLQYGCKKLILVGDHKQLGPTILNNDVKKAGYDISLFERLISLGMVPYMLTTQYRMHPELSDFSNVKFYDGLITSGVSIENRGCFLPYPTFFYCSYGQEECSASGTSFLNRSEALMVQSVVNYLIKNNVRPRDIGVITCYEGQKQLLGNLDVEVMSVDGFQGREKDFVILSLVRSNDLQGIGFVRDPRRMNVSLSRARYGTIIVGNPNTFLKDGLWKELLDYYQDRGWIVDGPLNNLKQVVFKKCVFDFKMLSESLPEI